MSAVLTSLNFNKNVATLNLIWIHRFTLKKCLEVVTKLLDLTQFVIKVRFLKNKSQGNTQHLCLNIKISLNRQKHRASFYKKLSAKLCFIRLCTTFRNRYHNVCISPANSRKLIIFVGFTSNIDFEAYICLTIKVFCEKYNCQPCFNSYAR